MPSIPVSILKYMDGNSSLAVVASFICDIGRRLGHESPESFAESYQDEYRDRTLDLHQAYMKLAVKSLEMLGWGGYGRATKPTSPDALELIQRQREVRANLLTLDETNKTGESEEEQRSH